jgi:mannonate dehydratase
MLPRWADTSPEAYCSRGRAHAIGYLQGVLGALGISEQPPVATSEPAA